MMRMKKLIVAYHKTLHMYPESTLSHDLVDDTVFFELGTSCTLLQSLTIVSDNDNGFDYLPIDFDYIKVFTEGCRNLKYLDIQAMLDCQSDLLTSLGTISPLLEILRLVQDDEVNDTAIESSSFQCLFKGCPLQIFIYLRKVLKILS